MLVFQDNTMETVCLHAQSHYPKECCGIMLGRQQDGKRFVYQVIPTHNMVGESKSETHFFINPLEVMEAEILADKENIEIVGFYHSHPDYEPVASEEDILYMIAGYSYPIISVKDGACVKVSSYEKCRQNDSDVREEIVKEK